MTPRSAMNQSPSPFSGMSPASQPSSGWPLASRNAPMQRCTTQAEPAQVALAWGSTQANPQASSPVPPSAVPLSCALSPAPSPAPSRPPVPAPRSCDAGPPEPPPPGTGGVTATRRSSTVQRRMNSESPIVRACLAFALGRACCEERRGERNRAGAKLVLFGRGTSACLVRLFRTGRCPASRISNLGGLHMARSATISRESCCSRRDRRKSLEARTTSRSQIPRPSAGSTPPPACDPVTQAEGHPCARLGQ
jgi:hypothetical protein